MQIIVALPFTGTWLPPCDPGSLNLASSPDHLTGGVATPADLFNCVAFVVIPGCLFVFTHLFYSLCSIFGEGGVICNILSCLGA